MKKTILTLVMAFVLLPSFAQNNTVSAVNNIFSDIVTKRKSAVEAADDSLKTVVVLTVSDGVGDVEESWTEEHIEEVNSEALTELLTLMRADLVISQNKSVLLDDSILAIQTYLSVTYFNNVKAVIDDQSKLSQIQTVIMSGIAEALADTAAPSIDYIFDKSEFADFSRLSSTDKQDVAYLKASLDARLTSNAKKNKVYKNLCSMRDGLAGALKTFEDAYFSIQPAMSSSNVAQMQKDINIFREIYYSLKDLESTWYDLDVRASIAERGKVFDIVAGGSSRSSKWGEITLNRGTRKALIDNAIREAKRIVTENKVDPVD